MTWNWQLADWPNFTWDRGKLTSAEQEFLLSSGIFIGAVKHLDSDGRDQLRIEAMSSEAVTTSEIEGEILDRDSVQSSIRRQLKIAYENRKVSPAEQGIAEMMVDLYRGFAEPLTDEVLFGWHSMICNGRRDIKDIGCYRTHEDPMQIVSKAMTPRETVHFEAPHSKDVPREMRRFIDWFNRTSQEGTEPLPPMTRAAIAHLYFESIHPFEDGNGRIGRAISEKALAQSVGQPTFTALALTILKKRKSYYQALEDASMSNQITEWLGWFADIVLEASKRTTDFIEFLIAKTKMFDGLRGKVNERQEKALLRMFREGPDGFKGGLSASNYISITGATVATATRDLTDLVEKGVLIRVGERRYTRYFLNLDGKSD